jgi:hypothetical protein
MKEYKVSADIGDGEGGGYFNIATFSTIALALVFINGLKPMFGFKMDIMRDVLGSPKYLESSPVHNEFFKGVKLSKGKKEIETFY